MREVHYHKSQLLLQAAGPIGISVFGLLGLGGMPMAPGVLASLFGLALAGAPLLKILNGRPAIRFDEQTLEINTFKRSKSIAWTNVRSFDAVKKTTYIYGVIPIKSSMSLKFHFADGWIFGRTISVPLKQLDMADADVPGLLAEMSRTKGRSYDLEAASATSASVDNVTADAVIARYMAVKQTATRAPRRAVSNAAAATPALHGARAHFGRRPA